MMEKLLIEGLPLSSYVEGKQKTRFPVKEPAELPEGLKVKSIYYFRPGFHDEDDWLEARYTSSGDKYLYIGQGQKASLMITLPSPHILPEFADQGEVDISGKKAQWIRGRWSTTAPRPGKIEEDSNAWWSNNVIAMGWLDGNLRYHLEGKGLTLAQMVSVAKSLK